MTSLYDDSIDETLECYPRYFPSSMGSSAFAQVRVESILDAVDETLADNRNTSLDPKPIGPKGVKVVDQVKLTEMPWFQDEAFITFLKPLSMTKDMNEGTSTTFWIGNDERNQEQRRTNLVNSPSEASCITCVTESSDDSTYHHIGAQQSVQWNRRYRELVKFRETYGHCFVPNNWNSNSRLALWVKRQRYQFKLKKDGVHSTLSDDRERKLEHLGFVWDSHRAVWEERLNELRDFREVNGNCNVPVNYPENRQLAIWVKCQRRQYRLYCNGERSNMNTERILKLNELGFVWNPRKRRPVLHTSA